MIGERTKAVNLEGRVAFVTGASRGIGEHIVYELASRGCAVVLMSKSSKDAPHRSLEGTIEETAERARSLGVEVLALRGDVSHEAEVLEAYEATLARFGRCDILINNAAVVYLGTFLEQSVKRWEIVLDVNLLGPVLMCRAFLPDMVARGEGRIINITSAAGDAPHEGVEPGAVPLPYAASKAALNRFTVGLAHELSGTGVSVNGLLVEAVTERHNLPSVNERPDAPAQLVAWLASQPASLTGEILNQDDLLPQLRQEGIVRPWTSPR